MTFEERENERQENEALKNAKEISKKKNKDKQKQLVWKAVKTAMMPVILLVAKIAIIAILSITLISLFSILLGGRNKSSKAKDDNKKNASAASIWGCNLSREEFIEAAESYNGGADYQTYMAAYAGNFYDVCTEYDINPCYAYAHSMVETGNGSSTECQRDKNYFGYMTYNGQDHGKAYTSVDDAITDYCEWIVDVSTEGTSMYETNNNRGKEFAEENDKFNGTPANNIYVMFSTYSYLGDTHVCDEPDFDNPLGVEGYIRAGNTWGDRWKNYALQYI